MQSIDNKVLSAVTFDALEESLIKDAKLGYKYISDAELSVNKYKFNYLNRLLRIIGSQTVMAKTLCFM